MTPEEHRQHLRAFEVDRLLKLLTIEAKKQHDGAYAIFASTAGYQVAFGTPELQHGGGLAQLASVPICATLKEALIAALTAALTFAESRCVRGDMVEAAMVFEHKGQSCCRTSVWWGEYGTAPLGLLCECGAQFLFADWKPDTHGGQSDPIVQAIMHLHTHHHLEVEPVVRMFRSFPQFGLVAFDDLVAKGERAARPAREPQPDDERRQTMTPALTNGAALTAQEATIQTATVAISVVRVGTKQVMPNSLATN